MTGDVVEVLPTGTSTTVPATGLGGVAPGGSGRSRLGRRSGSRLILVAPDASAARRYLARRTPTAGEVLVIAEAEGLGRLAGLRLRRRDRVEWLVGWCDGARGRDLALAVECAAAVGCFGAARHAFAVDA